MIIFKKYLGRNFSNHYFIRKYVGGYWECWVIDIIHGNIWFNITKEQAYSRKWRPGCGHGTPYCEYYPINFFDYKSNFTEETKIQLERENKLKRCIQK